MFIELSWAQTSWKSFKWQETIIKNAFVCIYTCTCTWVYKCILHIYLQCKKSYSSKLKFQFPAWLCTHYYCKERLRGNMKKRHVYYELKNIVIHVLMNTSKGLWSGYLKQQNEMNCSYSLTLLNNACRWRHELDGRTGSIGYQLPQG